MNKTIEQAAQEAWAKIGEVAKDTGNDCIFFAFDNGYFIICDAIRPFAEEIARLTEKLESEKLSSRQALDMGAGVEEDLAKQMAAARDALRPFANYACDPPCRCHNCIARAALATPCPAADALLEDRARLRAIQDYGADNDIYAEPDGKWSIRERSGERTLFPNISECADCLMAAARKEGPQ